MKRVLIFRFSAMGDVALVLPVVLNVLKQNPSLKITIVTRSKFKIFFENQPNIDVFEADFENSHKGFWGLFRLFIDLKSLSPDFVFDLHQNIRTQILKLFFFFTKTKILDYEKGRSEKKKLTKNRDFVQLRHVTDRYLEVFRKAKLVPEDIQIDNLEQFFKSSDNVAQKVNSWLKKNPEEKIIGIAPFAQHKGKIWPLEKYHQLIKLINDEFPKARILVFGGGNKEKELVDSLKKDSQKIENLISVFSLLEELALIKDLDIMICGDSSNMHFATLSNIPVISIWGSTHTYAGFGALFQPIMNTIEIPKETLSCRPCSVYGNKPCIRKDYACLEWISPEMVFERVKTII